MRCGKSGLEKEERKRRMDNERGGMRSGGERGGERE